MMSVKIDTEKVIRAFIRKKKAVGVSLKRNIGIAGLNFISDINLHQMTGRPGLNRITGNLAKSWFRRVEGSLDTDIVLSVATRTKYARPHEYGKAQIPSHSVRNYFRRTAKGYTKSGAKRRFKKISIGLAKGGLVRVRSHFRKAHTKIFPKRLHVRARWATRGMQLFRRAILMAYREFSK